MIAVKGSSMFETKCSLGHFLRQQSEIRLDVINFSNQLMVHTFTPPSK